MIRIPHFRAGSLLLAMSLLVPATLPATTILPTASALGLNPGDTYKFVFVTSGATAATTSGAAFYNNFVQNAANTNGIGTSLGLTWSAIVGTGTQTNPVRPNNNAPLSNTVKVFLVNGTMVANGGTNPFYSSVDHLAPINITELGTGIPTGSTSDRVWTGGNATGSESGSGLLGSAGSPVFGHANGTEADNGTSTSWMREGNLAATNQFRLYAISSDIVVPAVPEPGTLALALGGLAAAGLLRRKRQ